MAGWRRRSGRGRGGWRLTLALPVRVARGLLGGVDWAAAGMPPRPRRRLSLPRSRSPGADFYAVPDPLPEGEHGTLIRYQPLERAGADGHL